MMLVQFVLLELIPVPLVVLLPGLTSLDWSGNSGNKSGHPAYYRKGLTGLLESGKLTNKSGRLH